MHSWTLNMARDKDTRENFVTWYKEVFSFTANAVTILYDVQMLKDCVTLSELDNKFIANTCKAVSKDTGQSVAELAMTRLKLLCFWIKHHYQTSRVVGTTSKPLVRMTLKTISFLRMQKHDKDVGASENKEPDYTPLTLDNSSTVKAFDKVKNLPTHVRGVTGIPLVYVMRHQLIPKDEDEDPPFGEEDTK